MFNISEVGPLVTGNQVEFRLFLPSVNPTDFEVNVYIIKRSQQFERTVPAQKFSLAITALPATPPGNDRWGDVPKDLWKVSVDLERNETYIYRYEIVGSSKENAGNKVRSLFFGDPYARETANGIFSVVRVQDAPPPMNDPATYQVPELKDAVIYEINVDEFANDFYGIIDRLPYLESLGVNVLELMPINSIAEPSQWGYMPIFYFAPEERFGGPEGFRKLIQACHAKGIAVILDMVYAHTDFMFPYQVGYDPFFYLWKQHEYQDSGTLRRSPNPMSNAYSNFGHKNDFRMKSVQEFFAAVNQFWLDEYHVDGFRYDHVNGYLDKSPVENSDGSVSWYSSKNRPNFVSLQNLTKDTYKHSKSITRFQSIDGSSRIIQIAEDLGESAYQLGTQSNSAVNGCWEKRLHDIAKTMAKDNTFSSDFGKELLLIGDRWDSLNYSGEKTVDGDTIPALPVQYLESHDESRLMYIITSGQEWDNTGGFNYQHGLHNQKWWKLQPYAIALMTSVGIPMLWAGQEFGENYGLPNEGYGRVRGARPLHWDYFYSPQSSADAEPVLPLTKLYRILGDIRKAQPALKGDRTHCVLEREHLQRKIIVYRRWQGADVVLVAINFSEIDQKIDIPFGQVGIWTDILKKAYGETDAHTTINVLSSSNVLEVSIPSSFGRIYHFT
ncbi:MAG: alpha-amylase family glycosyl hydrolase [Oculatellaceae cyanobacterium bins.114]|nr:alpha-amylase family glycosyl hydrolase [Oculatellaceae cyanobacterium bins.114]